jgi:hypothetical protein
LAAACSKTGDPVAKIPLDPLASTFGDTERRVAVERANLDRAEQRRSQLAALTSPALSVQERIQCWEKLHALQLPTDPNHRLVRVIAADTALAIDQVRREQDRRKES